MRVFVGEDGGALVCIKGLLQAIRNDDDARTERPRSTGVRERVAIGDGNDLAAAGELETNRVRKPAAASPIGPRNSIAPTVPSGNRSIAR